MGGDPVDSVEPPGPREFPPGPTSQSPVQIGGYIFRKFMAALALGARVFRTMGPVPEPPLECFFLRPEGGRRFFFVIRVYCCGLTLEVPGFLQGL